MIDQAAFAERLLTVDIPDEQRERILKRFGAQGAGR